MPPFLWGVPFCAWKPIISDVYASNNKTCRMWLKGHLKSKLLSLALFSNCLGYIEIRISLDRASGLDSQKTRILTEKWNTLSRYVLNTLSHSLQNLNCPKRLDPSVKLPFPCRAPLGQVTSPFSYICQSKTVE